MGTTMTPTAATQAVVWGAFALGLVLGAAGQASRFCVRGAIADRFVFGGTARLGSWVLAVAVAALGTQTLLSLQLVEVSRAVPLIDRFAWLSYLAGGLLFGYGMVLAAGCPQRSLVKAGAGNLKAVVTLLVAAIAAQMTMRGLLAEVRVRGLDPFAVQLDRPQDIGSLIQAFVPGSADAWRWLVVAVVCAAVMAYLWSVRASMDRTHWAGGIVIGLLVPAAWLLTGHVGFLAEHPDTLEAAWLGTQSRRPEALTFTAPIAHTLDLLTFWSDRNTTVTFGVTLTLGVLLGSFASSRWRGEFRVESFASADELSAHLVGGVLMGFGGVTALGCSIGQGLTGLAMLSAGAGLAVIGIVAGAVVALRVQAGKAARYPGTTNALVA
jgi:uncharacterized membrane protein YedE/YeeE